MKYCNFSLDFFFISFFRSFRFLLCCYCARSVNRYNLFMLTNGSHFIFFFILHYTSYDRERSKYILLLFSFYSKRNLLCDEDEAVWLLLLSSSPFFLLLSVPAASFHKQNNRKIDGNRRNRIETSKWKKIEINRHSVSRLFFFIIYFIRFDFVFIHHHFWFWLMFSYFSIYWTTFCVCMFRRLKVEVWKE